MKRIIQTFLILTLFMPTGVKALVNDHEPLLDTFQTKESCLAELSANSDIVNAANGLRYYLTCIQITCESGKIKHKDLEPLLENMTCANGNKDPFKQIADNAGIGTEGGLNIDASCTTTEELDSSFATQRWMFNCELTANNQTYTPTGNNNNNDGNNNNNNDNNNGGNDNNNNNNNGGTTNNPQTGIETYYAVLLGSVVILSFGLYIVNKQNLFKKI